MKQDLRRDHHEPEIGCVPVACYLSHGHRDVVHGNMSKRESRLSETRRARVSGDRDYS